MVIWTQAAKADLRSIHDFIKRDSPFYAKRVTQEIIQRTEKIERFPNLGKVVPEIGDDAIREIPVYSYRIIYERGENDIYILTVVHRRRNFAPE